MISGHVFIATSLDGYIARKDHSLDWLPQENIEGEDTGFKTFFESIDGLIMGRGSFETILSFDHWPYTKPVIVLSHSLSKKDVPSELVDKVRISDLAPVKIMQSLSEEGWKRVYIDGGSVVQSFIRAGLVEDIIITTIPILIGEGIALFGQLENDVCLKLVSCKSFPKSGMIQTHYQLI